MERKKFKEVVANSEYTGFDEGTIVTLSGDDSSECPWFVSSEYDSGQRHAAYIRDIKRLKKNKRKEKEVR